MRDFVRAHSLLSFVVLAYALSWADWVPLAIRHALVVPGGRTTHFPGLLGPALAAYVITLMVEGAPGVRRLVRGQLRVSRPTAGFFLYSFSPLGFLAVALMLMRLAGQPVPPVREFAVYSGLPSLGVPLVLLLVFIFNGYGEETGWRGFLLPRLQARFGPVKGTFAVALIWAGWHVPSFWFVEGYRSMGPALLLGGFGLGLCAGAVVLARVVSRTQGSILAAAIWHATYNLTSATAASRGMIGAVTTTSVMTWAAVLLLQEWRRRGTPSRLAMGAA